METITILIVSAMVCWQVNRAMDIWKMKLEHGISINNREVESPTSEIQLKLNKEVQDLHNEMDALKLKISMRNK